MSFMNAGADIDFPEEWSLHTIEDVAHFARGLSWAKSDETDKANGSLVVSIPNIREGYIDFESKFNHYLGCKVPEAKRLSIGDIVFVGSSGSLQNVGRNAMVRELPGPSVAFASFTFKATPDQDLVDPDFFYYLVNSDLVPFADYCSRAADGKFNFQLVDFKSKQQLRLPLKKEQQRIAQVLSTVQQAIEQQERLIRTTTALKRALMQQLFTKGLRGEAQKETEIGLVPESWEVLPFHEFVTLQRGQDLRKEDFRQGAVPVIGATQVIGYHDEHNVKGPGVVVVRSGSSAGLPQYVEGDYWAHNVLLYVKDFHGNMPKFTFYKILEVDLTRFRQGVAVPTLNRNTFSSELIAVPQLAEQKLIASTLDSVESKTQIARRKTVVLQDLFRTLLHELMTGKVRVGEK